MDWADDVAYSVHDVEDGLQAGLVSLKNLSDHSERAGVSAVALTHYCPPSWAVTTAELESVFAEFIRLDCWQFSFDGGPAALVAAKNLTSELVGPPLPGRARTEPAPRRARARSAAMTPTSWCPAASCLNARCSRRSPRTT